MKFSWSRQLTMLQSMRDTALRNSNHSTNTGLVAFQSLARQYRLRNNIACRCLASLNDASTEEGAQQQTGRCQTSAKARSLAIITGASRGLGAQISKQLAALKDPSLGHREQCTEGFDFLLLSQNAPRLSEFCKDVEEVFSHTVRDQSSGVMRVVGHAIDLGNMHELEQLLPQLSNSSNHQGQHGSLPSPPETYASVLLVHNAGTTGTLAYSWDQTLGNIRREMDLNVVSPAAITAAVVSTFRKSKACKEILVVNISSVSATQPYEAFSVYAAGKAARLMLARTLARESDLLHNPQAIPIQQGDKHQGSFHARPFEQHGKQESGPKDADEQTPASCSQAGTDAQQHAEVPVILSLSYAPGALDTEMQAAARESLPVDAPLKAAFEVNAREGRLVDPAESARLLLKLLSGPRSAWSNGDHITVYDLLARRKQHDEGSDNAVVNIATSVHPLAY